MAAGTLRVNGRTLEVGSVDPHTTVLQVLRDAGLTGTKEGCAEGECGACAVVLLRRGDGRASKYEAVNSCLLLAAAVEGRELYTAEGLATGGALHPVQEALVRTAGSQCGYCTPGFVVSMFAEYYREGRRDFDPEAISGNLCRCTGYRPIRDAARQLDLPQREDAFDARLDSPAPQLASYRAQGHGARLARPTSLAEALELLAEDPEATILAGGTDLVVGINQVRARFSSLVSLEAVAELGQVSWTEEAVEIGACVSLSRLEHVVGAQLPMFAQLLPLFSSRLVRNRATLGGNLANASPIGDSPPALLALDAEVELVRRGASRVVPLDAFFTGYRKTVLQPGELLAKIRIPRPFPTLQAFYKVSKRVLDDISTVAAGFGIVLDEEGRVSRARLAYGGVAATPVRAPAAEAALVGKHWGRAAVTDAVRELEHAFTPLRDHRGSAAYRQAMVPALLEKFWTNTGSPRGRSLMSPVSGGMP